MVLKSRLIAPDWAEAGAKCLKHPLPSREAGNMDDPFGNGEPESLPICNGDYDKQVCPARDQCRFFGLINNEQAGTWGGLLLVQRQWVRRHVRKEIWDQPELWLHKVPPIEEFVPEEDDAEEDEASEQA